MRFCGDALRFLESTGVSGIFDSFVSRMLSCPFDALKDCTLEISITLFFSGGDSFSGVPGIAVLFSRLRFGCLVLASVGFGAGSGPISGDRPLSLVNSSLAISGV